MDILESEGWVYLSGHFEEAGFIPHAGACDVFAFQSACDWESILELIKSQWGYLVLFATARLLKKTKMKDGRTNFVFILSF